MDDKQDQRFTQSGTMLISLPQAWIKASSFWKSFGLARVYKYLLCILHVLLESMIFSRLVVVYQSLVGDPFSVCGPEGFVLVLVSSS